MSMPMSFPYASPEQVMKDKADYARKGIARGKSIVALEYAEGVVFLAENPSATLHKVFEIYDRIAFAGVGKYNEYENLRIVGIRHADLKGYAYAREDVTARSLANLYSQILGQIFTEGFKPYEVEILVAEVGHGGLPSELYKVTYDGFVTDEHGFAALGGQSDALMRHLKDAYPDESPSLEDALRIGVEALAAVENRQLEAGKVEAAVLDRSLERRKFRRLEADAVAAVLPPVSETG
jgi:proteasome alpha subunit